MIRVASIADVFMASLLAWTYQQLSNFYYLPFINVAISNTGLLFRSGVPFISILGTLSLIMELLFLFIITLVFVKYSSGTSELGDLIPVLEYLDNQKISRCQRRIRKQ